MTTFVIGVDGGGSKTLAIVADAEGKSIAEASGPASAVRANNFEQSAEVIASVVRQAVAAADPSGATPRVICAGVAGTGREPMRRGLWQALVARELADEVIVRPDYEVALDDAFPDGTGIVLIAGTGSVAFGRSPSGVEARCGGWGPVFGDEGSAAWIGRRALSVIGAATDGREPETALAGAIMTATEATDASDLIAWAADAAPAALAALAPVVMTVAESGDLRANSLIGLAVEELNLHVRALARQLFVDERAAVSVALSGGLLTRGSLIRKRLEHRLKSGVPGAHLTTEEVVPARGAVKAALRHLRAVV